MGTLEILDRGPEIAAWAVPGLERIEYRNGLDDRRDWALRLGAEGDVWTVFLHGHGSGGDQLFTRPDIRREWLPLFRARGLGILCPNLRENAWMGPGAVHDLRWLLEFTRTEFGARRFLFFSGSMGGTSNLIFAALHPELADGVVALGSASDVASYHAWCRAHETEKPILGEIAGAIEGAYGGPPSAIPAVYRAHSALDHADRLSMPLFLAHGAEDTVIPVSQSRCLFERLREVGKVSWFEEIPDGNHDSPLHIPTLAGALDRILLALQ